MQATVWVVVQNSHHIYRALDTSSYLKLLGKKTSCKLFPSSARLIPPRVVSIFLDYYKCNHKLLFVIVWRFHKLCFQTTIKFVGNLIFLFRGPLIRKT